MCPIGIREELSGESWNACCTLFEDAEFTQSFEWGEAKRYQGWSPIRLKLTEKDDCIGALQGLEKKYFGLRFLYCARGPLWQRRDLCGERCINNLGKVLDALREEFPTAILAYNWHFSTELVPDEVFQNRGFRQLEQALTSWIDLRSDYESILSTFHGKWRNDLRNAERSRVQVRSFEASGKFGDLYEMLEKTAARKGFKIGLDYKVVNHFLAQHPADKAVILSALDGQGEALASALIISFNGLASYLIGASISSSHPAFVRGASNLIQLEAIRWAQNNDNDAYNLEGLDPKGNPGVYHFKKRMNGRVCVKKGLWMWTNNQMKTTILGSMMKTRMSLQ